MTGPVWNALLWFAAVLVMIPVALWLLRRSPIGVAAGGGRGGPVRHVATLPLSPQQRLVTVEVGQGEDRLWLVLGVGAQGISTLHTMAPQRELAAPAGPGATEPATAFAQLLQRMRGPDRGGRHG